MKNNNLNMKITTNIYFFMFRNFTSTVWDNYHGEKLVCPPVQITNYLLSHLILPTNTFIQ